MLFRSVQFAPAARVARQVHDEVWIGAEYYSNFGPFNTFDNAVQQQQHTLFAVVDFVAFGVDVNFGIGFGLNDPADQLVAKVRAQGTPVWYIVGENEGHGFGKKENQDYLFWSTLQFWQQTLLK